MDERKADKIDFSKQIKKRSSKKVAEQPVQEAKKHIESSEKKENDEPVFMEFAETQFELVKVDEDTATMIQIAFETSVNSSGIKEMLSYLLKKPGKDIPIFMELWKKKSEEQLYKRRDWDGEGDRPLSVAAYTEELFTKMRHLTDQVMDPKEQ